VLLYACTLATTKLRAVSVERKRTTNPTGLVCHFKDTVALYFVAVCPHTLCCAYVVGFS